MNFRMHTASIEWIALSLVSVLTVGCMADGNDEGDSTSGSTGGSTEPVNVTGEVTTGSTSEVTTGSTSEVTTGLTGEVTTGSTTGVDLDPPEVPALLDVPAGNVVYDLAYAVGAQIYTCAPSQDDPAVYVWTLKGPDAKLFADAAHTQDSGTHFAGPTWKSVDGSEVVGMVLERADAPEPDSVPWLLLATKSTAGDGIFSDVTYIQRVDTVGGIAPKDGCDAVNADKEAAVDYVATYYFYRAG